MLNSVKATTTYCRKKIKMYFLHKHTHRRIYIHIAIDAVKLKRPETNNH